jgi:hypothetical protein
MSFENVSYRKKFYFAAIAAIVFAFITYLLAIKKTISVRNSYRSLVEELSVLNNNPQKKQMIENAIADMDYFIIDREDDRLLQEKLLVEIDDYCRENDLILREFPDAHLFRKAGYNIGTYTITVEGSFLELTKFLYYFENRNKTGKLVSAHYHTTKDVKSKKTYLLLTIYIQFMSKNNNVTEP